ncbi:hypothetical protein JTB14_007499 [Gonioctena quinquepunctata]|nr:hypothetical protein JTB14_007499 [Gonioctena quinquepunctata]
MRVKSLGLFFAVLLSISSGEREHRGIMKLLTEILVKQNIPSRVTAYLCWTKNTQMVFLKQLSGRSLPVKMNSFEVEEYQLFPNEHHVFLLDLDCAGSVDVLEKARRQKLFDRPFRWIFWGEANYSLIENEFFGVDSRVFFIEKIDEEYGVKLLYKREPKSEIFNENELAKWSPLQGFTRFNDYSAAKNRTDLMGMNINISCVYTNPDTLNHLEDYRNIHIDPLSKLSWILIHHLMSILNASSTAVFQNTWGYRDPNTSLFSGMIGDLQTGRAELGGTASFFTLDRIDVVEFYASSAPTYMKFIFRAPPLSYVTNVFTLPFHTYVWYSSFILIILIFFAIYVIVRWEWKDPYFRGKIEVMHDGSVAPLQPTFLSVILMEIGAITQQGTDTEPKSNAGRIATIFTFVALMFLYTSYSANIVALLQSTTESIRTLEDLLSSRISLGVQDIVYAHHYFEIAAEPVRKAIYQQKIAPKGQKPNFMTIEEGVSKMQKGFFGFHVEVSGGYKVVADLFQEHEKCGLKEISYLNLIEPWLAMKKDSPYKEIFKVGMRKIHESGLQRREVNKLYLKKPVCHSKGSNFGSAGLLDCYAAFLLFGIGMGCSMTFFFLEFLVDKYKHNLKKNFVRVLDEGGGGSLENSKSTIDVDVVRENYY